MVQTFQPTIGLRNGEHELHTGNERSERELQRLYEKDNAAARHVASLSDTARMKLGTVLNQIGEGFDSLRCVDDADLAVLKVITNAIEKDSEQTRGTLTLQLRSLVN